MNPAPTLDIRPGLTGPANSVDSAPDILALVGEMDIATTSVLRERLNAALSATTGPHRQLIIDLSGVSFCDASGLALLVGTYRRARIAGVSLRLAGPQPQMMKVLRLTGLDRGLTVYPTLAAAIAWRRQGSGRSPQRGGWVGHARVGGDSVTGAVTWLRVPARAAVPALPAVFGQANPVPPTAQDRLAPC